MSSSIAAISTTDSDEARALQFEQEIENKAPSTSNAQTTSTSTATSSKPAPSSSNNTKSNTGRKSTWNEIKNQSKDNQNPTSTSSNHPTTSTSTDTTSTRPTSSSIQHTSTNPTRSSGRKSREAKDKDQIKGKAPDVDRDGDVEMNQHPPKEISQKEQQTTDHQQDIREGDDVEHQEQNLPNPRLDIMRLGLERFMTVIDAKVSPAAISSSLPSLSPSILEDARLQFIGELKSSILDELSKLEEELSLPKKLRELQTLVEDSERRYEERLTKRRKLSNDKDKGKGKGKDGDVEGEGEGGGDEEEDKEWDVWRKDLDIKTAIHARNIPDQKERIRKMEEELESLQSETTTLHQSLIKTNETISNRKSDANQALELLRETVEALQPPPSLPDMKEQIREALQGLMEEIGPRR